jgi:hypothetical protein
MDWLRKTYYRMPPQVRAPLTPVVDAVMRSGALPVLQRESLPSRLERRLWGGFSQSAYADLRAMADDPRARPRDAAEALRALARWHGTEGDTAAGLALLAEARTRDPSFALDRRHYLLEALMLGWDGQGPAARALIEARTEGKPFYSSAALILANAWAPEAGGAGEDPAAAEAARLAAINAVFARAGLTGIARRDPALPLGFDNVAGLPCPPAAVDARVSVIVPLYCAEATLPTALEGLAAQSWHDLEVLIVDDASPDRSAEVAAAFCARDPRFRLLRQAENGGSYVARNRALAEATGEFVTVHDSDDWSHPEKIRLHVAAMRARKRPFTLSDWVRADEQLRFRGPWRPSHALVLRNFSSFFISRELLERAGGWDPVRVAADSELIFRLERLYRTGRTPPIKPGCPLSFGRVAEGQLTGSAATKLATLYHGVRREYHEARAHWHRGLDRTAARSGEPFVAPPSAPVPPGIRPARAPRAPARLLVVADFNRRGWRAPAALPLLRALVAAGLAPALLHYPRYAGDPVRPLDGDVRRFAAAAGMAVIAPGERLEADTVLVRDPQVFAHAMDRFPEIVHARLVVAPEVRRVGDAARAGLAGALGTAAIWRTGSDARPEALAAWLAGPLPGAPA